MIKYLKNRKIIKGNFSSRVFSLCKKITAVFCAVGIVMITNTPLVFAYEAHTVNITAKIVNNIPSINPPGGEFCTAGEFEVELDVSLAGADIYYTTDGTNPVCGDNKYIEPFELPNNIITTVKAVACHNIMRNGEQVLIQSAVMEKTFDVSTPIVNVSNPKNGDVWYCNPTNPITYSVEWAVENYRGLASELNIDIVYIIDNGKIENGGIVGEIDDEDTRFYNLPGTADLTGENTSYQFKLTQEYCYYGYGWMKVIATEPNDCGGFGISGRIFDPMVSNNSCDVSTPENIPAVSSDTSDANTDAEPNPAIDEEDLEDENVVDDSVDNEDTEGEESDSNADENADDVDIEMSNNNDEDDNETEEDIKDEDADDSDNDEEENDDLSNDDDSVLEEDGIIIDREEDFEEEENTDDDNDEEDNFTDDDVSSDDDDNSDNTDSDSDESDDDDSSGDAPIESNEDSTEIEFSL